MHCRSCSLGGDIVTDSPLVEEVETDSPLEEEVQTDSPWLSSALALLRVRTKSSLTEVMSDSRLTRKRPHGCCSWGNTLCGWDWATLDSTQPVSFKSARKTSSQAASWEAGSGEQASFSEFHASFSVAEDPSLYLDPCLWPATRVPACLPLENRTLLVLDE